jgi:hypothetical protein
MDRAELEGWIDGYERAWRSPGVGPLKELFAATATYRASPFAEPVAGLPAIGEFWDAERDGPDEAFTMHARVIAVDGRVGVVRVEVAYGEPVTDRWLDLWILELADDGRCVAFEEWPFAPPRD